MLYPCELKAEVALKARSPKIRRPLKIFERMFGYNPVHVGGFYDAKFLLGFVEFAEIYSRLRLRSAVKQIKKLRKEVCRLKKLQSNVTP